MSANPVSIQEVWQWRNRGCHSNASWRTIGDGSKPSVWWLQKEYRVVKVGSEVYLSTTDSRDIRKLSQLG